MTTRPTGNLAQDIVASFFSLPTWVILWVAFVLVPVNMASLFFLDEPMGIWIAVLANIAMIGNMPLMIRDRGFGKVMALPHLLPWTILVLWIALARPLAEGPYDTYLTVLLTVNVISLAFDYRDAWQWWRAR